MSPSVTNELEALLDQLIPIKGLPNHLERRLLQKAQIITLGRRKKLDAHTENHWILYLLDGDMKIVTSDRREPEELSVPSARCQRPIFSGHMPKGVALAVSNCRVIKIDRQLYEVLLKEQDDEGMEIHDVQINSDEGELFQQIYQAYSLNKLDLPTMPEVAIAIRDIMDDPDVSAEEIGRVIQLDPVVAGGIVQASNSALYRGNRKISNIRDAIVRIGLQATRDLVMSLAIKNIFRGKTTGIRRYMHGIWQRSVHVSALSYVIARQVRHLDSEQAMLAGLLHYIGAVPILTQIDKTGAEFTEDGLEHALEKLQVLAGVLVITQWGLDGGCGSVIEDCTQWQRDPSPQADLADVVLVAQLLYLQDDRLPPASETPAFKKLNLGELDENGLPAVIREAEDELDALKALLGMHQH
jgi:HD-like signal output (HDOD) protein